MTERETIVVQIAAILNESKEDDYQTLPVFDTVAVLKGMQYLLEPAEPISCFPFERCGQCRNKLYPGQRFCDDCGKEVKRDDAEG